MAAGRRARCARSRRRRRPTRAHRDHARDVHRARSSPGGGPDRKHGFVQLRVNAPGENRVDRDPVLLPSAGSAKRQRHTAAFGRAVGDATPPGILASSATSDTVFTMRPHPCICRCAGGACGPDRTHEVHRHHPGERVLGDVFDARRGRPGRRCSPRGPMRPNASSAAWTARARRRTSEMSLVSAPPDHVGDDLGDTGRRDPRWRRPVERGPTSPRQRTRPMTRAGVRGPDDPRPAPSPGPHVRPASFAGRCLDARQLHRRQSVEQLPMRPTTYADP